MLAPEMGELPLEVACITFPWIEPSMVGVLLEDSGVSLGRPMELVGTGRVLGGRGVEVTGKEAGVLLGPGKIVTGVGACVVEPQAMSTTDRITGTNTLEDKSVTGVEIFMSVSFS
jgi:hypothetical protein